jgi:hypothetical protein
MSIRQMLPIGGTLRKCLVCGYPITAKSDELTAHELQCLGVEVIDTHSQDERRIDNFKT